MGVHDGDFPVRLEQLSSELRGIRPVGLHRLRETPVDHLLREAARVGVPAESPMHAVEDLLVRAIDRLDDPAAARAARCTFGIGSGMRMQPAQDRRRAAADAQNLSVERFRRRREGELIDQVATEILVLPAPGSGAPPEVPVPRPAPDGLPAASPGETVRVTTFADEVELSLHNLLAGAVRVAVYGKTWVNLFNQHTRRLAEVAAAGGEVRVVLLRPDPGSGEHIYASEVWSSDHILARNLTTTHERLREIHRLCRGAEGTVEVRETDVVPQFGFIATSTTRGRFERGIAQLNFAHTRVEADRLVLCLTAGSGPLDAFVDEFEAAWAHGTPWSDGTA